MKRFLIGLFAFTFLALSLSAQETEGYNLQNKGVKFYISGKNEKGEFSGRVETSYYKNGKVLLDSYDKKNIRETAETLERKLEYIDGKLTNPGTLQIIQIASQILTKELFAEYELSKYNPSFTLEGEAWLLPADTEIGKILPDHTVRFYCLGANFMTIAISEAKVIGKDVLTINGEKIDCLVIESKRNYSFFLEKSVLTTKEWYGLGYGVLKIETTDKKGKPNYSAQTTKIEKLLN